MTLTRKYEICDKCSSPCWRDIFSGTTRSSPAWTRCRMSSRFSPSCHTCQNLSNNQINCWKCGKHWLSNIDYMWFWLWSRGIVVPCLLLCKFLIIHISSQYSTQHHWNRYSGSVLCILWMYLLIKEYKQRLLSLQRKLNFLTNPWLSRK